MMMNVNTENNKICINIGKEANEANKQASAENEEEEEEDDDGEEEDEDVNKSWLIDCPNEHVWWINFQLSYSDTVE